MRSSQKLAGWLALPVMAALSLIGMPNANASKSSAMVAPVVAPLAAQHARQLAGGGAFILRAASGDVDRLILDVRRSGASVTRRLPIIGAVAARVPAAATRSLARSASLAAVAPDAAVRPMGSLETSGSPSDDASKASNDDMSAVADDDGSMHQIVSQIRADHLWKSGAIGVGVDIAVVDTGVAPVTGLAGKIVNGPDISLDVPYSSSPGVDAFGHGTHIAGIAAGLDPGTTDLADPTKFVGVAPGARVVNVKVGAFDGATDVSQVIAGIDWVVQHKRDHGLNIRVLNLSYGTDSTLPSADDPLSWAAEVAWRNGIVVVVSAGNDGSQTKVLSPANNPLLIAVGAADQTIGKFTTASFTSTSGPRQPDLWAPGAHVLGLRVPNSFIDARFPSARVGSRLFRGSGTSQATAVVSGAAALLLSAHPTATPDQIKAALVLSTKDKKGIPSGVVDVATADKLLNDDASVLAATAPPVVGTPGRGSLEAARGGFHLLFNGVPLQGDVDIFGNAWNGPASAIAAQTLTSWSGGTVHGAVWAGASWAGASWAGASWAGASWAGASWAGASWAGASWAGQGWASNGWRGWVWG